MPAEALGVGSGLIKTETVSLLEQLFPSVVTTTYVEAEVGLATGFGQEVQLRPVEGLQENVLLTVAFNEVLDPKQTDTSAPALTAGRGLITT